MPASKAPVADLGHRLQTKRRPNMTRVALLERLKELQRLPKFQNRDIRTISACLTMDALIEHVRVCEEVAGVHERVVSQAG
jgi:hypothetical protein